MEMILLILGFVIVILVLGFSILNLGAMAVLRYAPQMLTSPQEMIRDKYIERFETGLKPYLNSWFALKDGEWDAFAAEYRRASVNNYAHEPFSEYKHPAREGRFINMSPHGFRMGTNQGPWPLDPRYYNIFFLGGSTLLNVGPDWATMASYLQSRLNEFGATKEVRVYNFGRGAYFSSLEKALLFNLLADGHKPDMALFIHGANDAFFYHGFPATNAVFTKAIDDMNQQLSTDARNKDRGRPKWILLANFFSSLPLIQAITLFAKKHEAAPAAAAPAPPLSAEQINVILDRWERNRHQIEAVCDSIGVKAVFVWQPTPAYKYDMTRHKALPYFGSLHGHERAGPVYDALRKRLNEKDNEGNLIWAADIHENIEEPVYLDSVHYTAGFNRIIAEEIAREINLRALIKTGSQSAG